MEAAGTPTKIVDIGEIPQTLAKKTLRKDDDMTVESLNLSTEVRFLKIPDQVDPQASAGTLTSSLNPSLEVTPSETYDAKGPVRYRLDYCEPQGSLIKRFESSNPFEGLKASGRAVKTETKASEPDVILEVVTKAIGPVRARYLNLEDPEMQDVHNIAIEEFQSTKIILHSACLIETIRKAVSYYPSQAMTGETMTVVEPYSVLMHHLDDLMTIHERSLSQWETLSNGIEPQKDQLHYHLQVLLEVLQPTIERRLRPLQDKLLKNDLIVTFDTIPFLFRSGIDIYVRSRFNDLTQGEVLMSIRLETQSEADKRDRKPGYKVECFTLESNGSKVTRNTENYIYINYFEGEKDILSLEAYPSELWDARDGGARRREYEEAGKKHCELLRAGHKYMRYSGYIYSPRRVEYDNTPVIVDLVSTLRYKNEDKDTDFKSWDFCETELHDAHPKWSSYDDIEVGNTQGLTKHQYWLMSLLIPGFIFKEKSWKIFDVRGLSTIEPNEGSLSNLVMNELNMKALRAVCETKELAWNVDFIGGKGDGQVVLLYGPPGVGKTYTVESICEAYGRPLLALAVADIGLDDDSTEDKLVEWFNLAEHWDAVLLLDEADIFMEKRSKADVKRNALVSVFLRRMEYFKGLFFLTTNRVGQIDDAFLSRVTVVLGYDKLSDNLRAEIWNRFFAKLEADMEQHKKIGKKPIVEIDKYARKYVRKDDEVQKLEWNGREIRNALHTAITLATYRASKASNGKEVEVVEVETEDFESVVRMSQSFRTYMDSITGMPEAQRAALASDRNDSFRHG